MGALAMKGLTVAVSPSGPLIMTFLFDLQEVAIPPIPEMHPATGLSSQSDGHSDLAVRVTFAPVSIIPSLLIFSPFEHRMHLVIGLLAPISCTQKAVGLVGTVSGKSRGSKNAWAIGSPATKKYG